MTTERTSKYILAYEIHEMKELAAEQRKGKMLKTTHAFKYEGSKNVTEFWL